MALKLFRISFLLFALVPVALAAQEATAPSLDAAVIRVQHKTGGRILTAEQRHLGRRLEYRVKVLTPDGHVRVFVLMSDSARAASAASSTQHPPADGADD